MDFIKDLNIDKIRNAAEDAFNQAKPKSDVEARVYEVLSHKNWGSSSTLMNEIARDTSDYDKFPIISRIMWESMENQRPAAWRVVFKGLTLLEHLIKNGNERCVDDARNHSHTLRALHQFNYYEGTIDRGLGVREKSKQIVELLGDDERIREERAKARQLREKFGGNAGGVGGGGSKYAGYGNDGGSWNGSGGGGGDDRGWNSGGGGASGGYSDGGIGSSRGGGGYGGDSGGGYSGRYSENHESPSPAAAASTAPTFATLPDEGSKKSSKSTKSKKGKKKKKSQTSTAEATAGEPEVDLFSFDSPPPAPAPAAEDDGFDDFQSASAVPPAAVPDPFATNAVPPQQQASFNAFGGNVAQQQPVSMAQPNAQFDAFGAQPVSNNNMGAMNNMFGNMSMQQNPNMMGNSGNMIGGQQQMMNNPVNGGGVAVNVPPPSNDGGDEFGDFEDAAPAQNKNASSDPLSKLISLDSLTKNKKEESKLDEPIVATPAAAQYVQNLQQPAASTNKSAGSEMSFSGIDGLNKTPNLNKKMTSSHRQPGQPIFSEGTASSGNASLIGMLSPDVMMSNQRQQQQPQQGGGSMMQSPQYGQMNQGMNMQGGMMNQGITNMQGGGMNNMQAMGNVQGGGMSSMQGGMIGQGMNNMQGGMNVQGGMSSGQMGMNNMQGGMMGQGMNMQGGMMAQGTNMQGGMNSAQMGMMGGQAQSGASNPHMGGQNMAGWQ